MIPVKPILTRLLLRQQHRRDHMASKTFLQRCHIDLPLLISLLALCVVGLVILYSAVNQDLDVEFRQMIRLGIAFLVMLAIAQISPFQLKHWAPWLFGLGMLLLLVVLVMGEMMKGAQRWLGFGFMHFQPSELMKLAVPMMVAWFLSRHYLPPSKLRLLGAGILIFMPVFLIAKQPDLGTALIIVVAGASVLLLAGMRWYLVGLLGVFSAACAPILWHFMRVYQRQRVLTFLNPERDPLGSGYHIIQSKIALGSGGLFGKGWLSGTQSHLDFLPEHATDFIFAVCGEEFGLIGNLILLALYLYIAGRGLYIAYQAQDVFTRLLAGSLSITFFLSVFVNVGMVSGILPVVGLPLPLVSYGGSSMVTVMAGFGILMSIHTHRNLLVR